MFPWMTFLFMLEAGPIIYCPFLKQKILIIVISLADEVNAQNAFLHGKLTVLESTLVNSFRTHHLTF